MSELSLDDIGELVKYDEHGQPVVEAEPIKTFAPNSLGQLIRMTPEQGRAFMETYYGLPYEEIGRRPVLKERTTARCGAEVWTKNLTAHESHCPACRADAPKGVQE